MLHLFVLCCYFPLLYYFFLLFDLHRIELVPCTLFLVCFCFGFFCFLVVFFSFCLICMSESSSFSNSSKQSNDAKMSASSSHTLTQSQIDGHLMLNSLETGQTPFVRRSSPIAIPKRPSTASLFSSCSQNDIKQAFFKRLSQIQSKDLKDSDKEFSPSETLSASASPLLDEWLSVPPSSPTDLH